MPYVVKQPTGRGQVRVYLVKCELLLGKNSAPPDAATLELLNAKGIAYSGRRAAPSEPVPADTGKARPARLANVQQFRMKG